MGVDFYSCHSCGKTFPDCGRYVSCECGTHWCSDECAEDEGFTYDDEDEPDADVRSCNFCRKSDVEDYELVEFLLDKLNLSREDAVKMFYEENSEEN